VSNYPPGAANDPSAPYNQPDNPPNAELIQKFLEEYISDNDGDVDLGILSEEIEWVYQIMLDNARVLGPDEVPF